MHGRTIRHVQRAPAACMLYWGTPRSLLYAMMRWSVSLYFAHLKSGTSQHAADFHDGESVPPVALGLHLAGTESAVDRAAWRNHLHAS